MHRPSLYVLVYVDDLIITGNNSDAIATFKRHLGSFFHMKDLGTLKYFLGIEIASSESDLFLCQLKYALDILSEASLLVAKPTEFPMEQNHSLATVDSPAYSDPEQYKRFVGRLIYLTITRPELCYSVHTLAQFMQSPKDAHWVAGLRVLHYVKAHPGQGYFIMLCLSPVSWKTEKQFTFARSSAEAEYRSMAAACNELMWIRSLLTSLGITLSAPMRLFCDSQVA